MDALDQDSGIAIVGMGCRFPKASGIDEFWETLLTNTDAVVPVPEDRFDVAAYYSPEPGTPGRTVSRHGGFLDDPFSFDAAFFGISPAEARGIDPQQRLLLPVVWEALEAAGLTPSSLAGSRTGVFIGQATGEYALGADLLQHGIREATGSHIRAMSSGRISYALDLRGPSLMVDTACSSSLVAVHLARQSLLTGESDLAIVGGVNVILSPQDAIAYSQAAMLSPDGRCKFGDAGADGFVRSEGVGVVVLKRLADARRDGDPVAASILGSAVTNDGRGSGLLLQPAVSGQVDMLREACRSAGISPRQLDYVEAHGTGTAVGDGVEFRAMAEAVAGRPADRPLPTGSVKSNIGHTEAAAGIAGLIKAVLIAQHGVIPASLHVDTPHPELAAAGYPVRVVRANEPVRRGGPRALLGVSSFGLSGTNAHVVLGEQVDTRVVPAPGAPDHADQLLVLSARSPESLRRQARAFARYLGPQGAGRTEELRDVCASAALRREAHPHRLWAVGTSHDDLAAKLRALADGEPIADGGTGEAGFGRARRNVFVFPGQGSQWLGMGRSLMRSSPAFREAMTACSEAVRQETGWSVTDLLASPGEDFPDDVEKVQPALWAMEVALTAAWREMGVEPDAVLGHSMGEVTAACVAGALTLRDAAAVICRRSRLMQRLAGRGAMLAAELTLDEAEEIVAARGDRVCVAVENAPTSIVLAGEVPALLEIGQELERRGVHNRLVKVNVASHSPLMDGLRDELLAALDDLAPLPSGLAMLSTVHCAPLLGPELDAGYWADNLRRPVRFAESVRLLAKEAASVFIEVSPHPLLHAALDETLRAFDTDPAVASSGRRGQDERRQLTRSLGQVFVQGGQVHWERWFPAPVGHVGLPHYAWDEQHLRRQPAPAAMAAAAPVAVEHVVDSWQDEGIAGVELRGLAPIPPTAHLLAALDAARSLAGAADGEGLPGAAGFVLEQARLGDVFVDVFADPGVTLRSRLVPGPDGTGTATVEAVTAASTTPCLTARLRPLPAHRPQDMRPAVDSALTRCREYLSAADFARLAETRGYRISPPFQAVQQLWRRDGEVVARLRQAGAPRQAAWETCLQPLLAAFPRSLPATATFLPRAFGRVQLFGELADDSWVRVTFSSGRAGRPAVADVFVSDSEGRPLAEFREIQLGRYSGPQTPAAGHRIPLAGLRKKLAAIAGMPGSRTTAVPAARVRNTNAPTVAHSLATAPARSRPAAPAAAGAAGPEAHPMIRHVAMLLGTAQAQINIRRPLRDYGLDSLTATQLSRWLRAEHGVDVSVGRLLGEESIRGVIADLAG